jgi:hypothetical protein
MGSNGEGEEMATTTMDYHSEDDENDQDEDHQGTRTRIGTRQ